MSEIFFLKRKEWIKINSCKFFIPLHVHSVSKRLFWWININLLDSTQDCSQLSTWTLLSAKYYLFNKLLEEAMNLVLFCQFWLLSSSEILFIKIERGYMTKNNFPTELKSTKILYILKISQFMVFEIRFVFILKIFLRTFHEPSWETLNWSLAKLYIHPGTDGH